ncbi:MAG TPA: Gfo/Idh/MocA family oxidoreductase, partial [Puia sp.]|nr:Gfo/Idh/MocA family oxidoreductase [Puia sp.]
MNTRRSFIKQAGLLAGGSMVTSALIQPVFGAGGRRMAASDRINIGAIGINGMGWSDLNAALKQPGVNVVALCDIDKNVLDRRMKDLSKLNINTSKIKTTGNYQDVLNNKDVDAVIIGTPDHW